MKLFYLLSLLSVTAVLSTPVDIEREVGLEPIEDTPENTSAIQKRGCYTSGADWGSKKIAAKDAAWETCERYFQTRCGAGCGNWPPFYKNEERTRCVNLGGNKKVQFTLKYIGDKNSRRIDSPECYNGLYKEIKGCDKGGHTVYVNWEYRADPNDGTC